MDDSNSKRIAIVGMSCRFAGDATNPEKLWRMLAEGRSAWSEIPSSRFNLEGVYHPRHENISTTHVRGGHFLEDDIALFDAAFFNFSAETAATLDPQYRLLLESVYEALENAGITMEQTAGSNTSVFAGAFFHDYHDSQMRDPESLPRFLMTGNGAAMASNRVSHFYDMRGPSMTIDTGCSTTLTALHQACQSLKNGESDMSIVAGSNLMINPDIFMSMGSLGFLSPDGKSYAFDSRANGYGRGEGVATIVLKFLDDALKAGDPIRAVIRETHINQDGKTETITSPNQKAQEQLIRSCYQKAGLDFRAVQYFEAHGTGTPTGDPIEVGAIASVFQRSKAAQEPLVIGSVKTNLGHTEPTSGLASVIKVALAMERGLIPPNVNFEEPNKGLLLHERNLKVPTECQKWATGSDGIRRASVNSFGYGGTNAHVIMEDWPSKGLQNGFHHVHRNGHANGVWLSNGDGYIPRLGSRVFILSAKDEHACRAMATNLKNYLQSLTLDDDNEDDFLDNLAYTLGQRRTLFPWVSTYAAGNVSDLIAALNSPRIIPHRVSARPRIGFVFTGQGAQWHAMGRELIDAYPVFRASIQEASGYLREFGCEWSLLEELLRDAETSRVGETWMSTPLCIAVQISLVRLLESWGVSPKAIGSHSSGEIAAAYAAGALTYRSAMAVSYCRAEIFSVVMTGKGGMIAVGLGPDAVEAHLKDVKCGKANVACYNSPSSVTVSGDATAIEELEGLVKKQNAFARRLRVGAAFHSHHMKPLSQPYLKEMQDMGVGKDEQAMKHVQYASPTTGTRMTSAAELGSPEHWVKSMLSPVMFVDSFRGMALDSSTGQTVVDVVIEVGPHGALAGPIGDILTLPEFQNSGISYLSCLVRKSSALDTMHALAGQLMCKGFPLDLGAVNFPGGNHNACVLRDLPPYPWNHQVRHWFEPRVNRSRREKRHAPHDLLGSLVEGTNMNAPAWRHIIRPSELPWVRDHTVQSNVIYPGAGYICMAIEAAHQLSQMDGKTPLSYQFRDVEIQQALVIPDSSDGIEVQIMLRPANDKAIGVKGWREFQIYSTGLDNKWTELCKGLIKIISQNTSDDQDQSRRLDSQSKAKPIKSHTKQINPGDVFAVMRSVGICHGPLFQNLDSIQAGDKQSVVTMSVADIVSKMPGNYQNKHVLHPTTLDSVFVSAYSALPGADSSQDSPKVPKSIKNLWVSGNISSEIGHRFKAHSKIERADSKSFQSVVFLVEDSADEDVSQEPVLVVDGLVCQSLGTLIPRRPELYKNEICSTLKWGADLSLIEPAILKGELSFPLNRREEVILMDLRRACFHYLHDALGSLTLSDVQQLEWHHKKFYAWLKQQDALAVGGELVSGSAQWIEDTAEEKQRLFDTVTAASVNGELVCRLGPQLVAMLRREVTPLELMMEGKLLYKYYQDSLGFARANSQLSALVRHFVHRNPRAKILEIGAGTGGATTWVLDALGSRKSGSGPLASEYHFTDVSSGFFEAAQEKFADWSDILTYRKLDIEADPAKQGFECGSYDLIVACQVLHATTRMDNTMANVRSLLKSDGKLMLFETTKDQVDIQFAFGLLPGWWLAEEEERKLSPTVSIPLWDHVLKGAGFNGVELEVHDCESEELYSFSVIMSAALPACDARNSLFDSVVLVSGSDSTDKDKAWHTTLQNSIANVIGGGLPDVESLDSIDASGKICIFLGEVHRPLLSKPSPTEFEAIKALALKCKGLLWITRGGAVDCEDPEFAMSHGFLRSLRNEYSGKRYISLDLDPRRPALCHDDATAITKVFAASFDQVVTNDDSSRDFEFAEREGVILIPRLHKDFERNKFISADAVQNSTPQLEPFQRSDHSLILDVGTPGLLETLVFRDDPTAHQDIAANYIELEPKAFGLNFRDVMAAMDRLNERRMGLECSGIITRVGSDAALHGYKVGDHVLGLLDGQYASRVRLPWTTAYPMPPDMTFEKAASIPMVFATAYISLYDTAKLCKGQSVLIHSATGGVGQAAVILSQLVGAEIFVTAGTEEKRNFMINKYGIPADHVLTSRDASFVHKIMSATNGRGVDVVLNSLSGQLLQESFNCIASFGHFVEIGRYDVEQNNYLEMVPFARSVSFSSIDLLALTRYRSSIIHRALAGIVRLFEQMVISTVDPITIFPLAEIEKAFRQMQAGKHIGKMVISVDPDETVPVLPHKPSAKLRPDASYLIVGGVGGVGRVVAGWMLEHGAKNLILLSRSANAKGKTGAFVTELEQRHPGSKVTAIGCDISNDADLSLALRNCATKLPPIRGVVQGAMVLQDSILEQMTIDQYNSAVGPKVQGTWNLHQQLGSDLDFFIMLSSLAGVIGYASQSNYTAGGAFQDALARYRTANGLPGVAIDLGVIKAVGYVAEHESVQARLTRIGHTTLSEDQILAAIESAILNPSPQIMIGINTGPGPQWDTKTGSPLALESRFSALPYRELGTGTNVSRSGDKLNESANDLAHKLASAPSRDEAAGMVMQELTRKLVDIFMIPADEITASKSMSAFGVDSLVAVELRNMLALQAGAEVSIFDIMQSPSLAALSSTVASASAHVVVS